VTKHIVIILQATTSTQHYVIALSNNQTESDQHINFPVQSYHIIIVA